MPKLQSSLPPSLSKQFSEFLKVGNIDSARFILDQAIEEGVRRGYHRAYKHTDDPTDEAVINTIEDCVMSAIYEYFDFDDEV